MTADEKAVKRGLEFLNPTMRISFTLSAEHVDHVKFLSAMSLNSTSRGTGLDRELC